MNKVKTVKELKEEHSNQMAPMTHTAIGRHKDAEGNWVIDILEYNPTTKDARVKNTVQGTKTRENMIELFKLEVVRNDLLNGEN